MKVGIAILWIAVLAVLLVALFMVGYEIAGIFGGILAVALVVGSVLLLAFLLGNLIDFILPDY